jgi:hypothetical protein
MNGGKLDAKAVERFWSKVERGPSCWRWRGTILTTGYGQFSIGVANRAMAHRLSVELSGRELPPGSVVLHECDTPACVRPDHLRVGTQLDNMRDAIAKGRSSRRGRNGKPVFLCQDDYDQIRRLSAQGWSHALIAKAFGVTPNHICNVVNGRRGVAR